MSIITQKRILATNWLKCINEITGENYTFDNIPCYGGYQMYLIGEKGEHYTGYLGFHGRMKIDEFLSYLQGIIGGLNYYTWQKSQNHA